MIKFLYKTLLTSFLSLYLPSKSIHPIGLVVHPEYVWVFLSTADQSHQQIFMIFHTINKPPPPTISSSLEQAFTWFFSFSPTCSKDRNKTHRKIQKNWGKKNEWGSFLSVLDFSTPQQLTQMCWKVLEITVEVSGFWSGSNFAEYSSDVAEELKLKQLLCCPSTGDESLISRPRV